MDGKMMELLARVEAATGADRELDLALATALVPDVIVARQRDDDSGHDPHTYWEYTGKIDDALALVERLLPGACGLVKFGLRPSTATVLVDKRAPRGGFVAQSTDGYDGEAATPPLAILAALLRALSRAGE